MRLLICGAAEAEFANVASTTDEATFVDVVGVVTTCEELISVVTKERVDVCLASSGWMRDLDHIRRYVDIHQVNTPKWVIMTFHLTGALCLEAAHLKVDDLIDLREGFDGFIQRLLLVSNGFSSRDGGFPVPPRWDNSLLFVRQTVHDQYDADIMRSLLRGKSNSEIAEDVHLSCQTVNNRISHMIQRSNTTNRTQLALLFAESRETSLSSRSREPELH